MTIDPASGVIDWLPGEGGATAWNENVTVEVSDGSDTATQSFSISVTPVNDAPTITSTAPLSAVEGALYQYTVAVSDSDDANNGTDLTFALTTAPAGMTISPTGVISWTPPNGISSADVTVQVSDGGENAASAATQSWTITVGDVNDAPVITSTAPTSATEGQPYSYQVVVNDPDDANNGTDLAFSLTASPAGMTISSTGAISWTPGENGAAAWTADVTVQVADGGENGVAPATQSFTINVTPVNNAPEISEGDSVSVSMSEDGTPTAFALTLNATDADSATLTWSVASAASNGTAVATGTGNSKTIQYTPNADYVGSDSFVVRVSDGELNDDITVNVTINDENDAPVITSTPNTSATEDVLYQYSASSSDVDGPSATWNLTQAPAGMTVSSGGLVQWTPGENGTASWSADVTLQVSDGTLSDSQSFTINVTPVNDAPTITSSAVTTATEEQAYSYQLVVNDADDSNNGTDLTFSLTQAPSGMTISATGLVEWTPAEGVSDADVTVEVEDGGENGVAAATQRFTITVTPVNDAPTITSVAPTSATEAALYSYQLVVNDPDDSNNGTDLAFSLTQAPSGMSISATGLIEWTPADGVTSANVAVEVTDGGEDGAAAATQSWTINVTAVNDAPVITEGDSANVSMSEDGTPTAFALVLNATDGDSATLSWSIASAAVNGTANVTGTGNSKAISYTPTADFNGSDSFVVRVSDGTLSDDITVNVTINAVNDVPTITSTPSLAATEGATYQYNASASDVDSATLTWTLLTSPAGMTINASTGAISWTPGEGGASAWSESISVRVSDGEETATQNFSITVTPVNNAPVISEGSSTSVSMSEDGTPTAFALTLNASDADSATLTWSVATAASNGTAVATGTGNSKAISYTPTADFNGSDSFVVRVSDGSLNDDITVNVTVQAVNDAPVISSTAPLSADEGIEYNYDVAATDVDSATLTYSLTTAPSGMTIDANSGVISWTPGDGGNSPWTADVTVSVSDGSDSATQSFTITVTPELPVVGRVMKGVLANATVEAALYDAGNWITLATTTTNADGRFGFDLPPQSAPVRIRATTTVSSLMTCDAPAGCDTALFGETVVPAVDLTLDTIVPGAAFAGPIAVTPLTNMAAQWLADLPGGINNDVILLANRRIADLFGMDENFIYQRPVDITDAAEVAAAIGDSNRMRHALFSAATQQLATNQVMALDTVTRGLAQMFSVLGGQMLLQTGAIDLTELGLETDTTTVNYVGLDEYITAATQVANQVNSGGALDTLIAALPNLVDRWGGRALSALGEGTGYNAANFARALAPLDEFDYYYNLAEDAEAGINETNRSVGWLYVDETAQTNTTGMVNVLMEALGLGFDASICVPARRNNTSCNVDDGVGNAYANLNKICSGFLCSSSRYDLVLNGTREGQSVNVTVTDVPDIRYLLGGANAFGSPGAYDNSNGITLCYNGTISNGTAVMTLNNFCINPNLSNNDMTTFNSFTALDYTNETKLNNALEELVANLYIALNLSGNATITSTNASIGSYTMQNMAGGFTFNRRVITQGEGGPLITIDLDTLQRTNPAGETLFNLSGTDMFNLSLGDTSTLHIANGAVNLGLPELRSITDGTVIGLEPLNDVISDYLLSMIDTTVPEPVVDWDQVMLDLENVVISGTSTMEIRDTTNKLYTFTLNTDGTVDVSQVNSLSNAM
ncbi:MAG: tandem-95 repeat protein, partial [Alcanivoracaceae bacterium]|nr:tandem-95 repeat protein [Alcanivoracaceae bacterium]